jgi:hypothetical protein
MKLATRYRLGLLALAILLLPIGMSAQTDSPQSGGALTPRDGQHDFDFLIGTWKFHLKRLVNPTTGSTTSRQLNSGAKWLEFDGTVVCRPIWGGRAQLEEVTMDGPDGKIQGLTLRLYSQQAHQWNLNWVNANNPMMGVPTIGSFDRQNGRGEFFDTSTSAHFEQSFSEDGGKTWEVNWITDQERSTP